MSELASIQPELMKYLRGLSRSKLHQRDPEAFMWDVLGKRWWSKQREIAAAVVNPSKPQTQVIVKSCNGIGKTAIAGDLATWAVAVHDPFETSVLLTAPIFSQIRANTMRYIADNYSAAKAKGVTLPGYLMSEPSLRVDRPGGGLPKDVIQAKRPADANLISSFQGTHDGYVMVIMDEAGGLPEDLWIGANAVTTNEHVAILAVGNPDSISTPFHRRFVDTERFQEWTRLSVSAYETPNFTGELIYPEDLERDREVKSHLVQVEWAEMMKRQAHPSVVKAKVYGEFPESSDTSFFTQSAMNVAYNKDISPSGGDRKLGVDLSFRGEDKSVAYMNADSKVRKVCEWRKEDNPLEHARRIHKLAGDKAATEVRIDASGAGDGVWRILESNPEFEDKNYDLYGVRGGQASPDNNVWAQTRAWQYDRFRSDMQAGLVDLDSEDSDLRDQMNSQTFRTNPKGAFQITPKDEMRKNGLHSPDHLDAAIYSYCPPDAFYEQQGLEAGTRVETDIDDQLALAGMEDPFYSQSWW